MSMPNDAFPNIVDSPFPPPENPAPLGNDSRWMLFPPVPHDPNVVGLESFRALLEETFQRGYDTARRDAAADVAALEDATRDLNGAAVPARGVMVYRSDAVAAALGDVEPAPDPSAPTPYL